MTEWMILQNEKPSQTSFDKSAAIRDLRPSISPWTEYSILDSRSYLCFIILLIKVLAMPTFICAGLVALLWRGLARKIALAITILCLVFILPSYYSQSLSEFFFPGSYAFLDDYVYIDGIDFKAVDRNTRIAAYDWRTFTQVGYKTIAFADGHIEWLDEAQARALFDAQGIPYPEPAPEGKRE